MYSVHAHVKWVRFGLSEFLQFDIHLWVTTFFLSYKCHENLEGLSSTTIPKSWGIQPNACSGTP